MTAANNLKDLITGKKELHLLLFTHYRVLLSWECLSGIYRCPWSALNILSTRQRVLLASPWSVRSQLFWKQVFPLYLSQVYTTKRHYISFMLQVLPHSLFPTALQSLHKCKNSFPFSVDIFTCFRLIHTSHDMHLAWHHLWKLQRGNVVMTHFSLKRSVI